MYDTKKIGYVIRHRIKYNSNVCDVGSDEREKQYKYHKLYSTYGVDIRLCVFETFWNN